MREKIIQLNWLQLGILDETLGEIPGRSLDVKNLPCII